MGTIRLSLTVIAAGLIAASSGLATAQDITDYTRVVRLDAKDPDARHGCGIKEQTTLCKIIVYYNDAIRRDPKDDDAYFHRGIAKLYAGALPASMADLSQADRLDPQCARMFLGETTPAAVLAAADDPDPTTRRGQLCEANFYGGELVLRATGCAREFVEGSAASAELALDQTP